MPELEPLNHEQAAEGSDPIAHLHKMSTTAGVGSQDYVAINNLAVVTAILGLATALAFAGRPFVLVGVAAIVCGIIAIWQISNSNGTQGGKGIAWLGMILALFITAAVIWIEVSRHLYQKEQERRINQVIEQMGAALAAEDYAKAYGYFHPQFQAEWAFPTFEQRWKAFVGYVGKPLETKGNNRFVFEKYADGSERAMTQSRMRLEKEKDLEPRRFSMGFRKLGPDWRAFYHEMFERQQQGGQGQQGPRQAQP